MSDAVKWGIRAALAVTIIGMILVLPVRQFIDISVVAAGISTLVSIAGEGFMFGRGLINNFLSPWARIALSGLMIWLIGKWFVLLSMKIMAWVNHYIFK